MLGLEPVHREMGNYQRSRSSATDDHYRLDDWPGCHETQVSTKAIYMKLFDMAVKSTSRLLSVTLS